MPNRLVEVNSWNRSACYPQGSFYPLSDSRSATCCRVTNSCFRTCSKCTSRSRAPFCVCAYRPVSNRPKGTFERLRYSLGGDRPSQTAHLTLSRRRLHVARLEPQCTKGSIPTPTPRILAYPSLSLLPILYIMNQGPISSCSKAPWGLSV